MSHQWVVGAALCAAFLFSLPSRAEDTPPAPGASRPALIAIGPEESLFPRESWGVWARRMLSQLPGQPAVYRRIVELINRELGDDVLDAHLGAFWGFHQIPENRHYRMRPWMPGNPARIEPNQVLGIPPEHFALIARVSMEIEDPIVSYSYQSGLGFRGLLPALGRFMGRDPESRAYAEANRLDYCDSAWCMEEGRHGNAFLRVIERLLPGRTVLRTNPSEGEEPLNTREYAMRHLDSRQATEWTASSTYATLLAHSTGPLHTWVRNIFRDEVKHLAILSAADRYLRGPQAGRRLRSLLLANYLQLRYHGNTRSDSGRAFNDPMFMTELVTIHVLIELRLQHWLRTLPHDTLRRIFETPSRLPDFARGVDPAVTARIDAIQLESAAERRSLSLWRRDERSEMFPYLSFLESRRADLELVVRDVLDGFRGAEDPTSRESAAMRGRISRLYHENTMYRFTAAEMPQVRRALTDLLRDYQISNNFETRAFRGETPVRPDWFDPRRQLAVECTVAVTR